MTGLRDLFKHKLSPVVGLTILLVVVGILAFALRTNAVDPRVTLEQGRAASGKRPAPVPAAARLAAAMDGEVSRTADRVGEATALALSAGVYLASAGVKGRLPRDVRTLMSGLAQNGLLPPGLAMTGSAGTLVSAQGSLSVRYRPAPLGVEVVSIASRPERGPALIVRLPDETSDKGAASLYVADRLQGVTVPAPFAPAAEVIALGWSPERLRSPK
ncbi:MAG: hypothetical protein MOB07_13050 [Acidobacteria bacterium]|nr:hypothetical protein [Acidobacteriota bacterium]